MSKLKKLPQTINRTTKEIKVKIVPILDTTGSHY